MAENEEKDTVVPLEEALLVNSPAQKRKLILSVLTDDPAGYYDLLQQARMDDDSGWYTMPPLHWRKFPKRPT